MVFIYQYGLPLANFSAAIAWRYVKQEKHKCQVKFFLGIKYYAKNVNSILMTKMIQTNTFFFHEEQNFDFIKSKDLV